MKIKLELFGASRDFSDNDHINEPEYNRTKSYGGQFHMDYPGLKDKVIFGMGGYGGNAILIDMENSRILVVNSLHYNNGKYKYNVKKLLIDPIKKGKQINWKLNWNCLEQVEI